MKQYIIIITDGYVESQTLTNITLFCLVSEDKESIVTPTYLANRFRDIAHLCDNKEDLRNMFSWVMDNVGDFWELIESNGFSFHPDVNVPITKVVYLENIIDYITDCESWGFQPENFNKVTGESHYFTEQEFKL